MKIQDIMNHSVKSCCPETSLAAAATMMWDGDCGIIPVLNETGKVTGMITDRDICIAVATKGKRADEISVGEVMSQNVISCAPENDPQVALATMRDHKVRRIPITDSDGILQGILSINDLILEAKETKGKKSQGPSLEEVFNTLKSICSHRETVVAAA